MPATPPDRHAAPSWRSAPISRPPADRLKRLLERCGAAEPLAFWLALTAALQRRHGGSDGGALILLGEGPLGARKLQLSAPARAPFLEWVDAASRACSGATLETNPPAPLPPPGDAPWVGVALPVRLHPRAPSEWWLWLQLEREGCTLHAQDQAGLLEAVARRLEVLMASVLSAPEQPVSRQAMLAPAERAELLEGLNRTDTPFSPSVTVPELFAEQVARAPGAVALVDRGREITYRQLDVRSNQLAHHLREACGVAPGNPVAVMLDGSEWLVTGLLGILKAGGAYLPVDTRYPEARIATILRESAVRACLGPVPLDAGTLEGTLARYPETAPPRRHHPDDVAYVIYTSGSTGRPKGILQTHRCLANFLQWQVTASGLEPGRRVLQFASPGFDVSVQEILFALLSGGRLFLIDDDLRHDLRRLARFIVENAIEIVDFPFSVISLLFGRERLLPRAPALRHLISAGEPLQITPELAALLAERPDLLVHNHYGPSETHMLTNHVLGQRLGNVEPLPPLGKPISNMRAYVLDEEMEPVPAGTVGEIFISGPGLSRGYLDPAMTAERFLPHPFRPGERIYRSRDLGRWRADGTLEILGRTDHQVKVRGFRIELGEIEAALRRHPSVAHAAVIARDGASGQRELVGFVTGPTPAEDGGLDLRRALERELPGYMIPARILRLDRFPLSANGKVDRAALAAVAAAATTHAPPAVPADAPDASLEQRLVALWSELLERPVAPEDDLFALGCDSLTVTRGLARMASRLGLEVRLRDFYAHPTLSALASRVGGSAQDPARLPPITPGAPAPELPPASQGQRSLWIFDQLAGEARTTYNFTDAFRFDGHVDPAAIRSALEAVVARHEVLRTTFATREGTLRQRVHERRPLPLEMVELDAGADLDREARARARAETARPFDLQAGPLVRAVLLHRPGLGAILLLAMHHAVSDAWSTAVLERDLGLAYDAFAAGTEPGWAPLEIQYRDFAAWQDQLAAGPAGDRARSYWRERLSAPLPRTSLPPDRLPPPGRTYRGESFRTRLPGPATAALRKLEGAGGITTFTWLLAGFAAVLSRWLGARELLLGSTAGCRQHPQLEDQVGLYVNLVPLRFPVREADTYASLAARLKELWLEISEHQHYPFTRLLEDVSPATPPGQAPLFDIGFQMVQRPPPRSGRSAVRAFSEWAAGARNQLWLTAEDAEGEIAFTVEHNTDLCDRATVERLFGAYARELEAMGASPDRRILERPGAWIEPRSFEFDFSA